METIPRTRVALKLDKRSKPTLLAQARAIYTAISANSALFPSPPVPLALFLGQIQTAETAQQATTTRTKGTRTLRDEKVRIVVTSCESLETYVQGLCDASPEQALSIIEAASMHVATPPKRNKPVLGAKIATAPGGALLAANRKALVGSKHKSALFNWQYTLDGGKTWVNAPPTPLATTEIQGLPSATTVGFRVSATVAKQIGPWSDVVTLLVH